MLQFHSILPVLRVSDLDHSIQWYTELLGFTAIRRDRDDSGSEFCFLAIGPVEILLSTGSHLGASPAFTGTLYFRLQGVDELFARVGNRAVVVWPLENQDYGTREFGIRDPDGYLLAFAEQQFPN